MLELIAFGVFYKWFSPAIDLHHRTGQVEIPFVIYGIIILICSAMMIYYWNRSKKKFALTLIAMTILSGALMPVVYLIVYLGFSFFAIITEGGNETRDERKKESPAAELYRIQNEREEEEAKLREKYLERQDALSRARSAAHYAKNHATPEESYEIDRRLSMLESRYYEYDEPTDVEDYINWLP